MSDRWDDRDRGAAQGGLALGVLLIVAGGLFLAGQTLNFDWTRYGWPLFVIVPGLALLVLGLAMPHEAGLGLAIPGGMVTTVGLILAFQSSTDTYASWAYAWALVAPGSVGAAMFLYGLLHRRPDLVDSGFRTGVVGLAVFVGFGFFFEDIVGLGEPSNVVHDSLPFLVIALGAIIVLRSVLPLPHSKRTPATGAEARHEDGPTAPTPPFAG
jgi:hypothetical protein